MEQKRAMRHQIEQPAEPVTNEKRIRVRLVPIWLRLVIVIVLIGLAALAGAVVGYSVIGGGSAWDVLQRSTWTHIVDIINKGA